MCRSTNSIPDRRNPPHQLYLPSPQPKLRPWNCCIPACHTINMRYYHIFRFAINLTIKVFAGRKLNFVRFIYIYFFRCTGCAKYPTAEESLAKKPVYYINVCKFKIVCKTVDKVNMSYYINDCNCKFVCKTVDKVNIDASLDAILGPKKSRFPGSNPLPLARV